jgi:hypothetical protein
MGLLSSRTFRQVATGALQGVEEKREKMRERIDVYREKAIKRKEEIQNKYNEYYDEEKSNIDTFKNLSTKVGQSYIPQLNSFVNSGGNLNSLGQMGIDDVRKNLDKYKPVEESYLGSSKDRLKIKSDKLNQSLQDQVGLFKGTSTLFTRDIEREGAQDIQTEVGNIDMGTPLDTRVTAGPGMTGTGSFVSQEKLSNNINYFNNTLRTPRENAAGQLVKNEDGSQAFDVAPGQQGTVNRIIQQAETIIENGFEGSLDDAIANVIEKGNNQNYDLPSLTTAAEGSPIDVRLTTAYNESKLKNKTTTMQELIDMFKERGLMDKANTLQMELDSFVKTINDEPVVAQEETTTSNIIPSLDTVPQGRVRKQVISDTLTAEDKIKNSNTFATEDFISQVREKNNVSRDKAIDILKLYGYTQFAIKEKVNPRTGR